MCKALQDIKTYAENQGRKQGRKQGEQRFALLIGKLMTDGRTEDAKLAAEDETARQSLYEEYGIMIQV